MKVLMYGFLLYGLSSQRFEHNYMSLFSVSDYLMGDQDGSQNLPPNQSEIGHVAVSTKIVIIVAFKRY